ncbi:MAG: TrmH family RNA methyltransferase [Acidimicrobiales bacterium]
MGLAAVGPAAAVGAVGDHLTRRFYAAYRDPSLVVLEGLHPAVHALRFGAALATAVTYDRDRLLSIARRLAPESVGAIDGAVEVVGRASFDRLCPRSLTSPLLAITDRPHQDLDWAVGRLGRPAIYLESPRNPGNVGAVIRVAAAADVAAVQVTGKVDPWSPVVVRSAVGLQFALPVASVSGPPPAGRPVVVLDPDGEPLDAARLDVSSVLVIGGERYGVSPAVRRLATARVALPMKAGVSSLNLATALSAVLFSWRLSAREPDGSPPW